MKPIEIVQTFYALFGEGKIPEALERCVALEAVLENPLPDPIPFGGRFEGRKGFARYLEAILAGIEMESFEVDEFVAEGDVVVVLGRETSRVRSTDARYTMAWVHVLRVEGDQIVSMREYNDTAAMQTAFLA